MNVKDEARNPGATVNESKAPTAMSSSENVEPDVGNSEFREPVARKLVNGTRIKAAGALMVSLISLLGGLGEAGVTVGSIVHPVFGGDPQKEIEAAIQGHYEAIGERDFGKAFDFYGPRKVVEVGGKEKWIDERTKEQKFCPIEKAEVNGVKVTDIEEEEGTAVATADVHFGYKCGQEDWRYTWNVSKADGEWKLDSREEERSASTPVPVTFVNEGRNESLGGKTKEANLKSVKTSATADAAPDSSEKLITYEPENVVDGKPDTAWQVALEDDDVMYQNAADGQPDIARQVTFEDGKEPWILLEYDRPITVSRVGIIPGYSKTDPNGTDRFYQMYTVRKARIEFSDGYGTEVDFEQDPEMKYVEVPNSETTSVRVTILDTYPPRQKSPGGFSYTELWGKIAISEIEVKGS